MRPVGRMRQTPGLPHALRTGGSRCRPDMAPCVGTCLAVVFAKVARAGGWPLADVESRDSNATEPEPGRPQSGYRFGPGALPPRRGANAPDDAPPPDDAAPPDDVPIATPPGADVEQVPAAVGVRKGFWRRARPDYGAKVARSREAEEARSREAEEARWLEALATRTREEEDARWREALAARPNYQAETARWREEAAANWRKNNTNNVPAAPPPSKPAPTSATSEEAAPSLGEYNTRVIPQDVRIAVAAWDGGRCRQCGSTEDLQYDHVIPWSRGGANTVNNVQLLCGECNRRKGARISLCSQATTGVAPRGQQGRVALWAIRSDRDELG
jgi:5-methylcytosine-specific restriction endonuclease McrA